MKYSFTFLFFLFRISFSYAQPGSIDSSFGNNGKVVSTQFWGHPNALQVQSNGKIVMTGDGSAVDQFAYLWLVARYNADGNLDSAFGENGKVLTNGTTFGARENGGTFSTAIQPDNKIVVGGYFDFAATGNDIALVRYNEDGSLDTTFGKKGLASTDLGLKDENVFDIALQKDKKIVVTGSSKNFTTGITYPFIIRYLADGSLDESFGHAGIIYNGFKEEVYLNSIVIQNDGKIVAGGVEDGLTNNYLLARYLADGTPDTIYGENGIARVSFPDQTWQHAYLSDLALQQDGKLVIVGNSGYRKDLVTVARLDSSGKVDDGFATNGVFVSADKKNQSFGFSILLQENKKIVITGYIIDGIHSFMAMRFSPEGKLDSTFGENGIAGTNFDNVSNTGSFGGLQKDGKIVLGGTITSEKATNFGLVRFDGDPVNQHPTFAQIKRWIKNHILHFQDNNPNTEYYVLEQSKNGTNGFVPVTKIDAATANTTYNYPIASTQNIDIFYRIKSVSNDNSVMYSPVIISADDAAVTTASLNIFPNPAKNSITIQSSKAITVRLQNSNGLVLLTQKINGKGSMDISKLPNGIYYLVNADSGESFKVVNE